MGRAVGDCQGGVNHEARFNSQMDTSEQESVLMHSWRIRIDIPRVTS